jgi:Ca2+-binding EF-hand superfamily protein
LKLARESERMKQELASRYDYNLDHLYKEVDDWNYKAIDTANLKRFLVKTGVFPNDQLLIAIIRRFDLDADAKIKQAEFLEGLRP